MVEINFIFGLAMLIELSIIDFLTYSEKSKGYIPSIFTTLFLLLALVIAGESCLFSLTILIIIALFFAEQELYAGIADLKVFIAAGLLMPSLMSMLVFAVILTMVSFITKFMLVKFGKGKTLPFIPPILIAFVIAWGITYFFLFA